MWYQIYVKAPSDSGYTDPKAVKRIDEHLTATSPAAFLAPTGTPVKNEKGEYEIRVFDKFAVGYVKAVLQKHYGLEITREVENP